MPAEFSHDRQQNRTFRDYDASRLRWYGRCVPGHRHRSVAIKLLRRHSHTTHLEQPTVPAELRASIHDLRCMREETASRQSQASCGFQPKGRLFTICCASKSTPVVAAHRANDRARCFRKTRGNLFFVRERIVLT